MENGEKIILASASPRRQELLREAEIAFEVHPAEIDEDLRPGELPEAAVMRLAELKAAEVSARFPGRLVLAADTMVVLRGRAFGKPFDLADAKRMLATFSACTHEVLTGVSLLRDASPPVTWCSTTAVTFRRLDMEAIEAYFRLVCPLDKAGSYAIQEHGDLLIEKIDGWRSNVIGLPIEEVKRKLEEFQG